ncbi:hypothetical protein [Streptomyces shenzhenensis]|uniref:Uncharacterized protein n=1 Tax=Streptomyces shenzhenensis TaxID=943815 RepID=A0A3M0HQD7_9ACTN|nr:hypothetical protein [Streptomyces shenzhenensis]RMB79641.1 hypothetical protein CTZ28_44315 [Streptomyces shenzhenensis]
MTAQDHGILIPTAQMFQELRQLHDEVKSVRTGLMGLTEGRTDHENRIRSLERRVWTASGAATVLGAGAGILAQFLLR